MSLPIASRSLGPVGNDVTFQARLVAKDGTGVLVTEEGKAIKQADCSSITCDVYRLDKPGSAPVSSPSITVAGSILDTLTDDAIWTQDTTGRNFIHSIAGSVFSVAGVVYRAVYALTLTGGTVIKWGHDHTTVPLAP